uniref:Uncharacterized protein n=1 Tax=Candidatus Kentrum sp. MB TaxID=2138164 RepID=A0A450XFY6_9GAMM|nr:MAG: hypothetical protein BECKMB1821G_GA0114241_103432 [Candidatus Kentron sp. MB]
MIFHRPLLVSDFPGWVGPFGPEGWNRRCGLEQRCVRGFIYMSDSSSVLRTESDSGHKQRLRVLYFFVAVQITLDPETATETTDKNGE